MKRTLLFTLLLLLLLSTLPVAAMAEGVQLTTEAALQVEEAAPLSLPEQILQFARRYTGEICGLLAFFGSLLLTLCYRSGMLPLLASGLGAVRGAVEELKSGTEDRTAAQEAALAEFRAAAQPLLTQSADMLARMSELEAELAAAAEQRTDTASVLRMQSELFYRIFMGANLPQYQKDELGDCYAAMRRVLEKKDGEVGRDDGAA